VLLAKLPVTVKGDEVPETERDIDGLLVTVYEEIDLPPVAPAVKAKDTVVELVTEAVPIVGAAGTVVAVIEEDEEEALPLPVLLDGVTVKV
jgi:hypothetical protein